MITVKEAVQKAMAFAADILGADRVTGMRLEEIGSMDAATGPTFEITLSFTSADENPTIRAYSEAMGSSAHRDFKVFLVSKSTGEVTAMKIRQLTAA